MTRHTTLRKVCLAALAALAACVHPGPKPYTDRNMDFGSVKTVAVLPFTNLSRDNLAGDRVREVFANMLLATNVFYVVPTGEVARALGQVGVANPVAPSNEEIVKLGQALKADGIFLGVVKEYGEIRSGAASANAISLTVQLQEAVTGRIVWSGSTTRGGLTTGDRLLGGGGRPINDVTEVAVDDLLEQLFR